MREPKLYADFGNYGAPVIVQLRLQSGYGDGETKESGNLLQYARKMPNFFIEDDSAFEIPCYLVVWPLKSDRGGRRKKSNESVSPLKTFKATW